MYRQPLDKRKIYTTEEKEYILSKTGGKCAHCGKKLTVKTMQKDHSIPWSKGGMSNVENIVPLCPKCNSEKADAVLEPKVYFKYLKKGYLSQLQGYFDRYLRDVEFLNLNNMFPVDEMVADTKTTVVGNKERRYAYKKRVTITKAVYSDLDEIYQFFLKYNEMTKIYVGSEEFIKKSIKDYISYMFLYGSIYITRQSCGDIGLVAIAHFSVMSLINDNGEVCEYNGKEVADLGIGVNFYLNTNIIFSLQDKDSELRDGEIDIEYIDDVASRIPRTETQKLVYYENIIKYISIKLADNFKDCDRGGVAISMSVSSKDYRYKLLLSFLYAQRSNPKEIDISIDNEYDTAYISDRRLIGATDYKKEESASKEEKWVTTILGSKYLYERVSKYGVIDKIMELASSESNKDIVFLHQVLDMEKIPYEDSLDYVVNTLGISFNT